MCGLTTAPSTACHPEPREGSGRALALAFAFAFLVVIPGGNLLLPSPLPLLVILSRAKDPALPSPQNSPTAGHLEGAKRVERPAFAFAVVLAFLSVIPQGLRFTGPRIVLHGALNGEIAQLS